jgi:hypothetical protein
MNLIKVWPFIIFSFASDILVGCLKIGDYILLKDVVRNSFLSVEGILQYDIVSYEGNDNLLDCIFCVHLQRQYSASRDLSAFLANYGNDVKAIQDESAKKYLLALQVRRATTTTKFFQIIISL